MIRDAFNNLLSMHKRTMTIKRGVDSQTISVSPSNYSRVLQGPANTTIAGEEFVITKTELDRVNWGRPKRGDVLVDTDLGQMSIVDIDPMYDFGGAIIGFRVRTG